MPLKHTNLRRLYETAQKDKTPRRFFEDIGDALAKKELRPEDFSIRGLFENFVENGRELVESFNPQAGGGVNLLEAGQAVDTAAFSNITGQIVYSALLEAYTAEQFVFSKLFADVPTQFNGEKIAGIGQLGDQGEIVGEGKNYPTAGVSEDWIETPATTKRGIIVPITKEAIFFDRTGLVVTRAREVGESLGIGKEKRAIDCLLDQNSTAHRYKWKGTSYASFQTTTPWVNVKTSNGLVDWTNLNAAEQVANDLVDPWTGEPILFDFTHLVCTKALEPTANYVMNATMISRNTTGYPTSGVATVEQGANPWRNKYQVLTSRLLAARMATDTDWILSNPTKYAKYMQNWPITVVQAANNSEAEFQQDIVLRFKASERGAYSVFEPRAQLKSTVA